MTNIVCFPLTRSLSVIEQTVDSLKGLDDVAAEMVIIREIGEQWDRLAGLGIDRRIVTGEVIALNLSIRRHWRHTMGEVAL